MNIIDYQDKKRDRAYWLTGISADEFLKAIDPVEMIPTIDTFEKAKKARRSSYFGSVFYSATGAKWVYFCTTIEEIEEAYNNNCNGAEIKWISLCNVVEEVKEAYRRFLSKEKESLAGRYEKFFTENRCMAGTKWIFLCKTIEEVREAYECFSDQEQEIGNRLPFYEIKKSAILKWISLCSTIEEAKEAYEYSLFDEEAEKAALIRIFSLVN